MRMMRNPAAILLAGAAAAGICLSAVRVAAETPRALTLPNFHLCFPHAGGVPGTPGPPTVDGRVKDDFGWNGALRYVFQNGTPQPSAAFQGARTGSDLYLSFEVQNDPQFDNADVIVLAFDPNPVSGPATDRRLIRIYPVNTGDGPAMNAAPRRIELMTWTGAPNWSAAVVDPPWLFNNTRVERIVTMSGVAYNVEMRIPVNATASGLNLPATGNFGLYVSVNPVNGAAGTIVDWHWPTDAGSAVDAFNRPPPLANWGTGTLTSTNCRGVSFGYNDIFTNQVPTWKIALNAPNIFNVRLHNNMISSAGVPRPATGIRATFRIANFGIPPAEAALWEVVPAPSNPIVGGSVPAGPDPTTPGVNVLSTGAWSLTPAQVARYSANLDQCMLVELDSTDPNTVFTHRSAWSNFVFGTASTFEHEATVSARGYERVGDDGRQRFWLFVTSDTVPRERDRQIDVARWPRDQQQGRGEVISRLVHVVHGCRITGSTVEIEGRRYARCKPVGAFGYGLEHAGTAQARWSFAMTGSGLRRGERGGYELDVPDGEDVVLTTRIEASDEAGPTFPVPGGPGCPSTGGFAALLLMGFGLVGFGLVGVVGVARTRS
jgi:hypothetical protein